MAVVTFNGPAQSGLIGQTEGGPTEIWSFLCPVMDSPVQLPNPIGLDLSSWHLTIRVAR